MLTGMAAVIKAIVVKPDELVIVLGSVAYPAPHILGAVV